LPKKQASYGMRDSSFHKSVNIYMRIYIYINIVNSCRKNIEFGILLVYLVIQDIYRSWLCQFILNMKDDVIFDW
jgi:pantothenate kinase-related protein Tda10